MGAAGTGSATVSPPPLPGPLCPLPAVCVRVGCRPQGERDGFDGCAPAEDQARLGGISHASCSCPISGQGGGRGTALAGGVWPLQADRGGCSWGPSPRNQTWGASLGFCLLFPPVPRSRRCPMLSEPPARGWALAHPGSLCRLLHGLGGPALRHLRWAVLQLPGQLHLRAGGGGHPHRGQLRGVHRQLPLRRQ